MGAACPSTNLPSSHGGGVLPGNQMGLSGAAARTAKDARDAALPAAPRKELRAPASPLLGSAATAVAEEEETSAIVAAPVRSLAVRVRGVRVELSVWCARQFMGI